MKCIRHPSTLPKPAQPFERLFLPRQTVPIGSRSDNQIHSTQAVRMPQACDFLFSTFVSGKQMEQIEPTPFATLKQDAAIVRSTRAFHHKGGSSQLYCLELLDGRVITNGM